MIGAVIVLIHQKLLSGYLNSDIMKQTKTLKFSMFLQENTSWDVGEKGC